MKINFKRKQKNINKSWRITIKKTVRYRKMNEDMRKRIKEKIVKTSMAFYV